MITVVPARTAQQLDAVRTLFREYAAAFSVDAAFLSYLVQQDFETELARLPGSYAPPEGELLLACSGEAPAGCVAFRRLDAEICEMKRLYVRPAYRGAGIGRRLAAAVVEAARQAGYGRMRLDTLASMKPAQRLYAGLGFRTIPPYNDSPITDAVYLELVLRPEGAPR